MSHTDAAMDIKITVPPRKNINNEKHELGEFTSENKASDAPRYKLNKIRVSYETRKEKRFNNIDEIQLCYF